MTDYDKFARFYDTIMGKPVQRIELIKQLIGKYNPGARTLLELGCGTGSVMGGLADDYEVSGLDRSKKMLNVARTKVPPGRFYCGNMADFNIGEAFDVIICVFDSINHLTDFEQWQSLFKRAFEHLNTGGLLIFDMDTLKRLEILAMTPFEEVFDGGRVNVRITRENGVFVWEWKIFEALGDNEFKQHNEEIAEVSFEITRVRAELSRRFEIQQICDSYQDEASEDSARVYFVVKKRPSKLGL